MKAKFKLGFLTGFKDVPNAWPGMRQTMPLLEPAMAAFHADAIGDKSIPVPPLKTLIFECRNIDDDKAAVFELLEVW